MKLDLKLVRRIGRDRLTRARILEVIAACPRLGFAIAAGDAETEGERAVLAGSGVELAQGYLFARPALDLARNGLSRQTRSRATASGAVA